MAKSKQTAKKAVKKVKDKKVVKKTIKKKAEKKEELVRGDIVVHNPTNPMQEFVVASEVADDEAIEAELMGKAMEHYVYSFKQAGKEVTGMTVAGVNEISRQLTKKKDSGIKIRIVPDSIKIERNVEEDGNLGVSVVLIAENMLTGETAIGAKFEPYKKQGGKGSYDNTFSLEKAVSKAERNAKRKLIPEKVAIEMIKKFVRSGNVQSLAPTNQPAQISAPAQSINYLSKLVTMLAREANVKIAGGVPTKEDVEKMIDVYNLATGKSIKSLKVDEKVAQKLLMDYINSPLIKK